MMPWWFWIITHVWVFSVGVLGAVFIHEDQWVKNENWKEHIIGVVLHIFAPIVLIIGAVSFIWEELLVDTFRESNTIEYMAKRIRKIRERIEDRKLKKEDLKEMEDNEDEWRIERLGIK